MIARPRTRTLVLALVLLAAGLVAGLASIPSPAGPVHAAAFAVVDLHRIDAISAAEPATPAVVLDLSDGYVLDAADEAFLAALLGPATGYTPEHGEALALAGHRVCEGLTAGVPLAELADVLAAEHGWTAAEGVRLVEVATVTTCAAS